MTARIPLHISAALMLGVVSQIGQVLLLREFLMVFHGNELSIGIVLAAWLAWVGAGSRLGAHVVDRSGRPFFLMKLSALGVFFLLPVTILAIRSLRGFLDILPGAYITLPEMLISCFMLMGPVCLLLGAQFILISRIWREKDRLKDTSGAGKTYVSEAAGNMLGGVLFTFVLVHLINPFQSSVLVTGVMLAAVFLILPGNGRSGAKPPAFPAWTLLAVIVLAPLLFLLLERLDRQAHELKWSYTAPRHELVETFRSKHGNIAVLKRHDQYSFFQSGHLIFSTAGPETLVPGLEGQEAVVFAHLAMVQHQEPARVLLIGGGLRGTLKEIIRHPVKKIDYIELDEQLIRAAEPYVFPGILDVLQDPRVNLIHTDARLFVKQAREKYDMIIVDAPDPATAALNRFYTREFFQEAKNVLNPDGVLVTGAASTPDLRGTAVANRNTAVYHTLADVFSTVLVAGDRFMFYFASNSPRQVSVDPLVLQQRYQDRRINAQGFSPLHYRVLLEESQLRRINWIVRNHGRSPGSHLEGPPSPPISFRPVQEQMEAEQHLPPPERNFFINSDFQPIAYYYTLMYWEDLTRSKNRDVLKTLLHVRPWWILPFMGAALLGVLGLRIAGTVLKRPLDASFAVTGTALSTGMSTMALQVALIFSFQNIYGFIYEMVGLIIAMFMLGLALGAFAVHRLVQGKSGPGRLALVQVVMAVLAALVGLFLPLAAGVQSAAAVFILFSSLTFASGIINGINFPLAAACSMVLSRRAEQSAGRIYSAELTGACMGAVLASAVVAPVMGIVACCMLAAAANATAFAALMLSRRSGIHGV